MRQFVHVAFLKQNKIMFAFIYIAKPLFPGHYYYKLFIAPSPTKYEKLLLSCISCLFHEIIITLAVRWHVTAQEDQQVCPAWKPPNQWQPITSQCILTNTIAIQSQLLVNFEGYGICFTSLAPLKPVYMYHGESKNLTKNIFVCINIGLICIILNTRNVTEFNY